MLFKREFLEGIRDGRITLAFRLWRRPSVKTGGTLLTAIGQLGIDSVSRVKVEDISERDARCAGYPSRQALMRELGRHRGGDLYRIGLGPLGADPRIALRKAIPSDPDTMSTLVERLERMDARSPMEPWTLRTLGLIRKHPAVRAGDLALEMNQERLDFKRNVRKLKALGLTESLPVGYRLSPRGVAVMKTLTRKKG